MSKLDRLAIRLAALEAQYRDRLIEGLRACAAGHWGLFGHDEHLGSTIRAPAVVQELIDLGNDISAMRQRLGLKPFSLHAQFLAARGQAALNAPGEPKQAQTWLTELEEA
ncbi:MAG TPA: hypothetical protein VGM25_08980 [Caulobacteraceae bacterium]|jgi:hypothetical protein